MAIVLFLMICVYTVCFILKRFSVSGIFTSWVNDLLSLPIILMVLLVILRRIKNNSGYMLPFALIVFAVLYQTIIFEFILPNISERYTYDVWDVVAYAVGGLFFAGLQNWLSVK